MRRALIKVIASNIAALFFIPLASAQENNMQQAPDGIFMVGALAGASSSALIGKDKFMPLPFIFYHNKYVTLETTSLYLHPVETGPFQVSAVGSMRVSNIELSSDDRLKDFDRNIAFEVGAHASFSFSNFSLYSQYLTDVTDAHGGEEITIGLNWEKQLGQLRLSAGGGAHHRSSELTTYLYGVTAKDAASGYVVHDLKSDWYPFAEVRASYPISGRWGLVLTGSAERLPEATVLSPIVEKRNNLMVGTGITYTF
ncbi:MAG: MipA/OmpV family protein [Kordiimonas sp.]